MNLILEVIALIIFCSWVLGGCENCIYIDKKPYCIGQEQNESNKDQNNE